MTLSAIFSFLKPIADWKTAGAPTKELETAMHLMRKFVAQLQQETPPAAADIKKLQREIVDLCAAFPRQIAAKTPADRILGDMLTHRLLQQVRVATLLGDSIPEELAPYLGLTIKEALVEDPEQEEWNSFQVEDFQQKELHTFQEQLHQMHTPVIKSTAVVHKLLQEITAYQLKAGARLSYYDKAIACLDKQAYTPEKREVILKAIERTVGFCEQEETLVDLQIDELATLYTKLDQYVERQTSWSKTPVITGLLLFQLERTEFLKDAAAHMPKGAEGNIQVLDSLVPSPMGDLGN